MTVLAVLLGCRGCLVVVVGDLVKCSLGSNRFWDGGWAVIESSDLSEWESPGRLGSEYCLQNFLGARGP